MPRLTVGTENSNPIEIHYDDHGTGRPFVPIQAGHCPGGRGRHRCNRSSRPVIACSPTTAGGSVRRPSRGAGYDYDTFTADLHQLLEQLDLTGVTLVGFSMGGGEVVRYIATHGTARVAKDPGGKGLLGSRSGAVSEAQRQYAVRPAEVASRRRPSTASPPSAGPTSAATSPS